MLLTDDTGLPLDGAARSWQELEEIVHASVGPSEFMEFTRFNLGQIFENERGADAPKTVRLDAGNTLIMKQMVEQIPGADFYAPITILVDKGAYGVHISYEFLGSYLVHYGNLAALKVTRELDAKIEALLTAAAV